MAIILTLRPSPVCIDVATAPCTICTYRCGVESMVLGVQARAFIDGALMSFDSTAEAALKSFAFVSARVPLHWPCGWRDR